MATLQVRTYSISTVQGQASVEMPSASVVLGVRQIGVFASVLALVDPESPVVTRDFVVTAENVDFEDPKGLRYLGAVLIQATFRHVFVVEVA